MDQLPFLASSQYQNIPRVCTDVLVIDFRGVMAVSDHIEARCVEDGLCDGRVGNSTASDALGGRPQGVGSAAGGGNSAGARPGGGEVTGRISDLILAEVTPPEHAQAFS